MHIQTLSGSKQSIPQLQSDNLRLKFCSSLVSTYRCFVGSGGVSGGSGGSGSGESYRGGGSRSGNGSGSGANLYAQYGYDMRGLAGMLNARNRRYQYRYNTYQNSNRSIHNYGMYKISQPTFLPSPSIPYQNPQPDPNSTTTQPLPNPTNSHTPKKTHTPTESQSHTYPQLQNFLHQLQQQFLEFGLDSELSIRPGLGCNGMRNDEEQDFLGSIGYDLQEDFGREQGIQGIQRGLVVYHEEVIGYMNKEKQQQLSRQVQAGQKQKNLYPNGASLIKHCKMQTPIFLELINLIKSIKQHKQHPNPNKTIQNTQTLHKLLSLRSQLSPLQNTSNNPPKTQSTQTQTQTQTPSKSNYPIPASSAAFRHKSNRKQKQKFQKYQRIFQLFFTEEPHNRNQLNTFLYVNNDFQMFEIVKFYDQFVAVKHNTGDQDSPTVYTLTDIQTYTKKVKKHLQPTHPINPFPKFLSLFIPQHQPEHTLHPGQFNLNLPQIVELSINKYMKWLTIPIREEEREQFWGSVIGEFSKAKRELIGMIAVGEFQREQERLGMCLRLLDFCKPFVRQIQGEMDINKFRIKEEMSQKQKMMLLLLVCVEKVAFNSLFQLQSWLDDLQKRQRADKAYSNRLRVEYFQQQLVTQLSTTYSTPPHANFITHTLPYLPTPHHTPLLTPLPNPQTLPWPHLQSLLPRPTLTHLLQSLIPASIRLHNNASSFLNTEVPVHQYLPHYEIMVLIRGLERVLFGDGWVLFGDKDRGKYFGMISVWRGEHLGGGMQGFMLVLEMLFQMYVLRQAILQQDHKSIALSLKSNLQPQPTPPTIPTPSLSKPPTSIHNPQLLPLLSTPTFLHTLCHSPQHQPYQDAYISYMFTLVEGIAKLRASRSAGRVVRRSQVELWVDGYLGRLELAGRVAQGEFGGKVGRLWERSLGVFAGLGM